ITGRSFNAADEVEGATAVIVNENLARRIASRPQDALGRRVRLAPLSATEDAESAPWLEIVGVVRNFTPTEAIDPDPDPLIYLPLSLQRATAAGDYIHFTVRLRGRPEDQFAGRLRTLAASVDPGLQVTNTRTAEAMRRESRQAQRYQGLG